MMVEVHVNGAVMVWKEVSQSLKWVVILETSTSPPQPSCAATKHTLPGYSMGCRYPTGVWYGALWLWVYSILCTLRGMAYGVYIFLTLIPHTLYTHTPYTHYSLHYLYILLSYTYILLYYSTLIYSYTHICIPSYRPYP